ncbi:hypothetical protein RCH09_002644 [Actimicrobium sp. GrIS 1.19]|uniref:T6SS immunity protein Tli4 family protein n=1 Tax=Actimicrobium sp. GrIS 1.19 TaxID=3071708 RepID=UPI002DFDB654|nr:hypothetical protein [Actimicrobium sp. GrIS 1.19]
MMMGTHAEIPVHETFRLATQCVGRFAIDLPHGALAQGDLLVDDIAIEARPMTAAAFRNWVADIEHSYQVSEHRASRRALLLEASSPLPDTTLLLHIRDGDAALDAQTLEIYKWSNGQAILMTVDVTGAGSTQVPAAPAVTRKKEQLLAVAARLRGRAGTEIPAEPGACFAGGFLAGPPVAAERIATLFTFSDRDGMTLSLVTDARPQRSTTTTLLARAAQEQQATERAKGWHTLRFGVLALNGMQAEEWLTAGNPRLPTSGVTFLLHANQGADSAATPLLSAEMNGSTDTPAAERLALAFWDRVSRTLRSRPAA